MRRSRFGLDWPRIMAILVIGAASITSIETSKVAAGVVPVITPVADPPGTPFLAPEADLGADWVSYQLDLQGTAGEFIRAVDVRIHGQLHQRWVDIDSDGIPDPTPNGAASDGLGDSHLNVPNNSLIAVNPYENNLGEGSPLPDDPGNIDYGIGSELKGVWGLPPGPGVTTTNIAYIVIPRSSVPDVKFAIQAAGDDGTIFPGINSDCPGSVCAAPNLDIIGNHHDIVDGDLTPSLLDGTNFGAVPQGSLQLRSFTFNSAGTGTLTLGTPTLTGPFSLGSLWPTQLPQNSFPTVIVQLNTSVPGDYFGSISFNTNDPLAPIFNFALGARVVPEPECITLAALMLACIVVGTRHRDIR